MTKARCAHRTGDTAVLEGTPPYWRILGRTSVDIIKSGGYKISALAVENALLTHERIRECAVLGLPDNSLGEAIAAVVACQDRPVRPLQNWSHSQSGVLDYAQVQGAQAQHCHVHKHSAGLFPTRRTLVSGFFPPGCVSLVGTLIVA
jgi:acyl-CoA synthetase (AMP-forming)/AMP-acid ligase II